MTDLSLNQKLKNVLLLLLFEQIPEMCVSNYDAEQCGLSVKNFLIHINYKRTE